MASTSKSDSSGEDFNENIITQLHRYGVNVDIITNEYNSDDVFPTFVIYDAIEEYTVE